MARRCQAGLETVVLDVGEELAELLGVPELHLRGGGGSGSWRLGPIGRVDREQTGVNAVAEDLVQRRVDVPDGLGVESSASALLLVARLH